MGILHGYLHSDTTHLVLHSVTVTPPGFILSKVMVFIEMIVTGMECQMDISVILVCLQALYSKIDILWLLTLYIITSITSSGVS